MTSFPKAMETDAPAGRFRDMIGDLAAFARRRLAGVAVLAVLAAAAEGAGLMMLVPVLQFAGIDGQAPAWANGFPIGLEGALALYVLLVAAGVLVVAGRGLAVTMLRQDYVDHMRGRLHRALAGMEWRAFSRLRGSDATHTITMETGRAAHGVDFLLRLAGWAIEIPALLAVALHLSPAMTAAALALAGVCLTLARPLNRRTHNLGQQLGKANMALYGDLSDDLAGMRVIRSLNIEQARGERFAARMTEVRASHAAFQRLSGLARAAMQAMAAAAAALAVWVAVRVIGMALADTLVLMMAFARLLAAALRIQDAWRTVLHALPAHAAVQALLAHCLAAADPAPNAGDGAPSGELRLEGVELRYAPDGPPALANVDAVIPAHGVTAVIGPSGAGKSTLADLLLGLTEPDGGRVLVGGRPLTGALRQAWRRRVGYVPQDSFLFHDTVRANLTVAAPEADDVALWAALEQAAAADFVRALPAGLDTVVGDRGGLLSGGQRQRLALARALLRDPGLLILDEATSALDHEHERRVLDALEALRGRLSIVVIAHRPSMVRAADHVIVLEAGRLVAQGDWNTVGATAAPVVERLAMA